MEPALLRVPSEMWPIIARDLSLGDLSALDPALSSAQYARVRQALFLPAAEALYSLLLWSPLTVTLKVGGEPEEPRSPRPSKRQAQGKRKRAARRSLPEYHPFIRSNAFGFRQVSTTSTAAELPRVSDLVISHRRVGRRRIGCPRRPFITPRHGKQPLEPTHLQLSLASTAGQFPPCGTLVLDYAKGDGLLSVTSDGEYRLRGDGVVSRVLPGDGEVTRFYHRSVFQNLQIQSAIWRTKSRDIELPGEWINDIALVFVRVAFYKTEPLTSPQNAPGPIPEQHFPGHVEFAFRNISIPLTLMCKDSNKAVEQAREV